MSPARAPLGSHSVTAFLRDHWQQTPLHIAGAFPQWTNPLSPDELAGLALEPEVEARLIAHTVGAMPAWQVHHGPLTEADFSRLPERDWTLLVQAVNHLLPEVAALLSGFDFLPNWRLDDVMVSYAAPGGSVGPHVDQYDVFLVQGFGTRRWQVGAVDADAPRVAGEPLEILADFVPTDTWVLEPGDLLYLPPGVPHHGVAETPCMTYSVGFRAPTAVELFTRFAADGLSAPGSAAADRTRFRDPGRAPANHPGEIDPSDRATLRRLLREVLADDDALDRWLGRDATRPRGGVPEGFDGADGDEENHAAATGAELVRHGASRWAYLDRDDEGCVLFVDGQSFDLPPDLALLARILCGSDPLSAAQLGPWQDNADAERLLRQLQSRAALEWHTDDLE